MSANPASAAVIAIGDELLLGEVENTNTGWLCRQLGEKGIEVVTTCVLPDRLETINSEVKTLAARVDLLLVCGGIGPTPDDLTRPAIAAACGVSLELNAAAVAGYQSRRGGELNQGQLEMCRLPAGCELIWSEFPSPPAFRINNIYVFPGVPQIMKSAWNGAAPRFPGGQLHVVSFVTTKGESRWFPVMQTIIEKYPGLKIGSYPRMEGEWRVELRVRGSSFEMVQAAASEFERGIDGC